MLLARTNCHGHTGLQLLAGSRISLWESIDAMPPSVSDAPGAPPFTLVWSMSMPSSYSVVVPVGVPLGVQGPAARPFTGGFCRGIQAPVIGDVVIHAGQRWAATSDDRGQARKRVRRLRGGS